MFDVGFWELVVLFGLGLMVLGPERMPKVAAQLGRWAGQARRMARNLSAQLQDEIEPLQSSLKSADETLRKDFSQMRPDVGQATEQGSKPDANNNAGDNAAEELSAAQAGPNEHPGANEPTTEHKKSS